MESTRTHYFPASVVPALQSIGEEVAPLLAPLHQFQVSIIARYVPAKDKLSVLLLLNRSWYNLISKNYAWTEFPLTESSHLLADFLASFDKFETLGGLSIPHFPGDALTEHRIDLLRGARSFGVNALTLPRKFQLLCENQELFEKISTLELRFQITQSQKPEPYFSAVNLLTFPVFLAKFTKLRKLTLSLGSWKERLFERTVSFNFKPLTLLEELNLFWDRQLVIDAKPVKLINFPRCLEILTLTLDSRVSFNLDELSDLTKLHTLSLRNIEDQWWEHIPFGLLKLNVDSLPEEAVVFLDSIISLEIYFQSTPVELRKLPLLRELVIREMEKIQITLDNLAQLRKFTLGNQTMTFNQGIQVAPLDIQLEHNSNGTIQGLEHYPEMKAKLKVSPIQRPLDFTDHYFIDPINTKILREENLLPLTRPDTLHRFLHLKCLQSYPAVVLTLPCLEAVYATSQYVFLSLFFNSPKLQTVELSLRGALVRLNFSTPLKRCSVIAKKIIFNSHGKLENLALNGAHIEGINNQVALYSPKRLYLQFTYADGDPKLVCSGEFNSLIHLTVCNTNSALLSIMMAKSPSLRQVSLQGRLSNPLAVKCPARVKLLDLRELNTNYEKVEVSVEEKTTTVLAKDGCLFRDSPLQQTSLF